MNAHSQNFPVSATSGVQTRIAEEKSFDSHDDSQIFYRKWPALSQKSKGAIVLFHRGHEHSGRMAHLVEELNMPDYSFYAWDARGHGKSEGKRGHAPHFGAAVQDVDCFIRHISQEDGLKIEDMAIIAQSVGAVLVSTWVHDYAPKIRAMVLASPAFSIKLYVPFALPAIKLAKAVRGDFFVNSYVKPSYLTHDKARIASYGKDPLITRPISANMLLGLAEAANRVVRDAQAITTPTQLLVSGADWVVREKPQHDFFVNLGAPIKERHILPGFYHDTLGEKDRADAIQKMKTFLQKQYSAPQTAPSLRNAHRYGFSRDEADSLASPLALTSLKGAYWAMTRASMKAGALLSKGIATGQKTGFDSGSMLDYVYRNQARGFGPIGRMIDRNYINAIGWRGIRQRKVHLEELINNALAELKDKDMPLNVVDIAAGHGRYMLEAIEEAALKPDHILLRDYSDINVSAGQKLIKGKGLEKIARFVKGDAFDENSLASLETKPTLGIVSGLYELFPDNDMIVQSLSGLSRAIPVGGKLIYTCQPWHPQLELIARALTSHREGEAWVMRRRSQNEMDQLVEAAGFKKTQQRIDQWGIFTVCVAERISDNGHEEEDK